MSQAAEAFRENVRSLMSEQGISIRGLGEITGMSYAGLSRVLSGHQTLTIPRAERIANALGVELSDILQLPENVT